MRIENELKREFVQSQLQNMKIKFDKSEDSLKNSLDEIEVIKAILENKESELNKLRAKDIPSENKYTCDLCEFSAINEKG